MSNEELERRNKNLAGVPSPINADHPKIYYVVDDLEVVENNRFCYLETLVYLTKVEFKKRPLILELCDMTVIEVDLENNRFVVELDDRMISVLNYIDYKCRDLLGDLLINCKNGGLIGDEWNYDTVSFGITVEDDNKLELIFDKQTSFNYHHVKLQPDQVALGDKVSILIGLEFIICFLNDREARNKYKTLCIDVVSEKPDINIEKPELADFKKVYKTLINDSYRKVPKNSSKLTNTDFERIKDDSLKVNGVLKKSSMKNPLENPNVRKFVKETKASTLETVETSNQLMILNESNLGERDLFIVVERQDVQTVMTINRDHPFFDKFVELEPNGRQLIITTLFSQYYAFLEVLNQNDFKASTYNIILDDFWRNQTDYLRRLYAL